MASHLVINLVLGRWNQQILVETPQSGRDLGGSYPQILLRRGELL
jgi:hypothetical protein